VVLEQPVAQVDCQVDLVGFRDLDLVLLVLEVDRHEFVADLWGVLGVVVHAEIALLVSDRRIRLLLLSVSSRVLVVALRLLLPSQLIEALSEENHIRKHGIYVELLFDLLGNSIKVQSKDLVDTHIRSVLLGKVLIVSLLVLFDALRVRLASEVF
jgi:hypothetical protein